MTEPEAPAEEPAAEESAAPPADAGASVKLLALIEILLIIALAIVIVIQNTRYLNLYKEKTQIQKKLNRKIEEFNNLKINTENIRRHQEIEKRKSK